VRAGVATGEKGREVVERVVDGLAGGAERFGKALSALEDSALVRRSAAAAHGALASVSAAAESAAAAAAATVKARRSVAGRAAAARAAASAGERALDAQARALPVLPLASACVHWLAAAPPLACEGLFSGEGNPEAVAKLAAAFKRQPGALVPLCAAPADVAALLVRHLEALPAPLLPHEALCRPGVPEARRAVDALDAASPVGGATAELVLSLAARVACVAAVTKMDAAKLARALAPALTRRTDAANAPAAAAPAAEAAEKEEEKEEEAPGSPLPAAVPAGAPSPAPSPAAAEDGGEAAAEDAAVVATLRWMIENWSTLRGGADDDAAATDPDETELSE
jgi:hypothetical protein